MVLSPAGSTSLARWRASDVARSAFAGVTARMMALSPCSKSKPSIAEPAKSCDFQRQGAVSCARS